MTENKESNYNKMCAITDITQEWNCCGPSNDEGDNKALIEIYELVDKQRGKK